MYFLLLSKYVSLASMSKIKMKKPQLDKEALRKIKKINCLRKMIREGRYEINFEKLAEKILEKCKIA